jgi:hypothetical protein
MNRMCKKTQKHVHQHGTPIVKKEGLHCQCHNQWQTVLKDAFHISVYIKKGFLWSYTISNFTVSVKNVICRNQSMQ